MIALIAILFLARSKKLQKTLFEKEKLLQKNEHEKKMADLEQTALRAQMNPHFIFNSLNSVQRFVINNDSEGVNTYLTTFAGLIRQTLENSAGRWSLPTTSRSTLRTRCASRRRRIWATSTKPDRPIL